MAKTSKMNRRDFLRASTATGIGAILATSVQANQVESPEFSSPYARFINKRWASLLAKHGYTEIEEEKNPGKECPWDFVFHNQARCLGGVAFWKTEKDGIIIREMKFQDTSGKTAHGTAVYAAGGATRYFVKAGYRKMEHARCLDFNGKKFGFFSCSVFSNNTNFYAFLEQGSTS